MKITGLISEKTVHLYSVVCKKKQKTTTFNLFIKKSVITTWRRHARNTLQLKLVSIAIDVQYKVISGLQKWSIQLQPTTDLHI